MPATAQFASRRSDLIVVESPASPVYEGGRQTGTKPGKYFTFTDHRLRVEGQKAIEFLRSRAKADDGPEIWEIDASDVPDTTTLLAELATADVARVREILRAEENGPARAPVVDTCNAVLAKMQAPARGAGSVKADAQHELA